MNGEYKYLIYHIPKTGGQSIRNALGRSLTYDKELIHLSGWGAKKVQEAGLLPFERRPQEDRDQARFIIGHHVHKNTHKLLSADKVRYITFFRNPAEQIVSRYNFETHKDFKNKELSFDHWYKRFNRKNNQTFHFICRFLQKPYLIFFPQKKVFKIVQQELKKFWYVGTTENIDCDLKFLFNFWGLKNSFITHDNVSGKNFKKRKSLDESLRQRLLQENWIDTMIYRHAQESRRDFFEKIHVTA